MTNLRVKLRLGSKSSSSESSPTSLPSSVISIERLRIKNNCLLQCMCIISKQILLYGSDVQLYNEEAFQNISPVSSVSLKCDGCSFLLLQKYLGQNI